MRDASDARPHATAKETLGSAAARPQPARRATAVAVVIALLGAPGCTTVPTPPPGIGHPVAYRVGAPDQLSVTILPEPMTQTQVVVRPDGMISIPLVGDVPAAGRTVQEIGEDIEKRISRFKRNASVSVALVTAASTDVTMLGEVHSPSAFPLVRDTRVVEAIGQVGGPTTFASIGSIRVIRTLGGETTVLKVKLNDIQHGDLSTNVLLEPGDIIYVPPTTLARVGYAIQSILFPFQPFLGIAYGAAGSLVRGR